MAHTGTLFLDEVGELDPRMQVKLLRVLDGVPYYRIGGQRKIAVDVRIVAATNRNLETAAASGRFRSDLYYRLNQCQVRVPPLRERRDDIVPIAEYVLHQLNEEASFEAAARRALEDYAWPGNVRELKNVVTRSFIEAESPVISRANLLLPELSAASALQLAPAACLDGVEKKAILEAFQQTGGHHQRTADLLGISTRTLSRKLKAYRSDGAEEFAHVN
jgi:DNA-binding NtrC family response regulator